MNQIINETINELVANYEKIAMESVKCLGNWYGMRFTEMIEVLQVKKMKYWHLRSYFQYTKVENNETSENEIDENNTNKLIVTLKPTDSISKRYIDMMIILNKGNESELGMREEITLYTERIDGVMRGKLRSLISVRRKILSDVLNRMTDDELSNMLKIQYQGNNINSIKTGLMKLDIVEYGHTWKGRDVDRHRAEIKVVLIRKERNEVDNIVETRLLGARLIMKKEIMIMIISNRCIIRRDRRSKKLTSIKEQDRIDQEWKEFLGLEPGWFFWEGLELEI